MTEINRRRALYLAGAGLTALAGCSESSDDSDANGDSSDSDTADGGNGTDDSTEQESDETDDTDATDDAGSIDAGDLPSYASVLPQTDRSEYVYSAIDGETLAAVRNDEAVDAGDVPTDPLVVNPLNDLRAMLTDLGSYASDSSAWTAYNTHDETSGDAGTIVYVNGVYAIVGAYDLEGLRTDLEDAGYEPRESDDDYAVYAHESSGDVLGVSSEAFAFPAPSANDSGFDPAVAVRELIETAVGRRAPKHEADDEFEWLLRAGGNGGITTGIYTDADEFDATWLGTDQSADESADFEADYTAFEGANGAHQRLAVADDNAARADAVVTYADEDRVDVDRLESSLGTDAESVDVTRDGTTVSIEADYGGEF